MATRRASVPRANTRRRRPRVSGQRVRARTMHVKGPIASNRAAASPTCPAALASTRMQPRRFGRYLLLDRVASGGMAEVWRVKLTGEAGFQRIFAIKKILPHVAEDEDFIRMFTDEALIASALQHGNIGQVYEFSKVDDTFFIGMEYVSGKDLKSVGSAHRARRQRLPLALSALIAQKMADGLDYAHRRLDNFGNDAGIVH